jgi:uncharacterized Tic20 family protein
MAERRAGYVIILLGSLLGLVVPVIHMMGRVWVWRAASAIRAELSFSSGR